MHTENKLSVSITWFILYFRHICYTTLNVNFYVILDLVKNLEVLKLLPRSKHLSQDQPSNTLSPQHTEEKKIVYTENISEKSVLTMDS